MNTVVYFDETEKTYLTEQGFNEKGGVNLIKCNLEDIISELESYDPEDYFPQVN